jgi:putative phosphoribosyl transferase
MNYLDVCKIDTNATVVLVDDGVASGATFIVAARWLKKFYNPNRIIVAATAAPKETAKILEDGENNDVEVITKPHSSSFNYVGQYYQDFAPVTDEQVIQIMMTIKLLQN